MTIIPMLQVRLAEFYGFDARNSVNQLQIYVMGYMSIHISTLINRVMVV